MMDSRSFSLLVGLVMLVWLARPAHAFGAGNIASIAKVEGQNWRHGDIEDALLTLSMARAISGKKFNSLQVSRVYFGNWLRDYSQAIDVGTVKSVSAEAIRLLLCVLGFLTFGYGSAEFEVTAARLGCYRPEDHIDNPKNYADNEDARNYDRRLRGPIDEGVELAVDPGSGMKNYIANERAGIMTSAQHVRNLFGQAIELGRRYGRDGNKADKYECLRLMGTGLHCLEDFFAHSNYVELALIEMGERDIFPHVGRDTQVQLQGSRGERYPIVTGTFGGVDFLHSVTGEVSDKLTQNEIEELEGTLRKNTKADTSILRNLLDMIPDNLLGGKHQSDKLDEIENNANASQLQNMQVSPREPEEYTRYVQQVFQQIIPVIEFHDDILKNIDRAINSIPVLPKIMSQLEEQLSMFVFNVIAPFILPVITQIREELRTGSGEIIQSSLREQHIVFSDDRCTDPTHSMLSKDHFTNILNEVAGRCAAKMVHWVVPQIMEAMDDENADVDRILTRIIHGILTHPAQRRMGNDGISEGRELMFAQVEEWWKNMSEQRRSDYRNKLSRRGVERGENHKDGVQDTGHGHGCAGKLKMRKMYGEPKTAEDKIADAAAGAIIEGATGALSGFVKSQTGGQQLGGGDGGFLGAAGSLLGDVFRQENTESRGSSQRYDDGSYTESRTEYGHSGDRYGQAQQTETTHPDGSRQSEYSRYEQNESRGGRGHGYEERTEERYSSGRREQTTESYESYGGGGYGGDSGTGYSERRNQGSYGAGQGSAYGGGSGDGYGERRSEEGFGERRNERGYGGDNEGHGHHHRREDEGDEARRHNRQDEDDEGRRHTRHDEDDEGRRRNRQDEDDNGRDNLDDALGGFVSNIARQVFR